MGKVLSQCRKLVLTVLKPRELLSLRRHGLHHLRPFSAKAHLRFLWEGHQSPPSAFLGKVLVSQTLRREHKLNQP